MRRPVRDADPETESAARHLMNVGGGMGEFLGGLGVDRRDRGGERDPLGAERQPDALRHVGEGTRHLDFGKAAALDLARHVERRRAAAGLCNQVEARLQAWHRLPRVCLARS